MWPPPKPPRRREAAAAVPRRLTQPGVGRDGDGGIASSKVACDAAFKARAMRKRGNLDHWSC
jgi:hypothetical protein